MVSRIMWMVSGSRFMSTVLLWIILCSCSDLYNNYKMFSSSVIFFDINGWIKLFSTLDSTQWNLKAECNTFLKDHTIILLAS